MFHLGTKEVKGHVCLLGLLKVELFFVLTNTKELDLMYERFLISVSHPLGTVKNRRRLAERETSREPVAQTHKCVDAHVGQRKVHLYQCGGRKPQHLMTHQKQTAESIQVRSQYPEPGTHQDVSVIALLIYAQQSEVGNEICSWCISEKDLLPELHTSATEY